MAARKRKSAARKPSSATAAGAVRVEMAAATQQGSRKRQEDNYLLYQSADGNIFISGVFDGHSSSGGGDVISGALVRLFRQVGRELTSALFRKPDAFKKFLLDRAQTMDAQLLKRYDKVAIDAGSTACIGFYDLTSRTFYTYNVGDSRLVFFETAAKQTARSKQTAVGASKGAQYVKKGSWHQTQDHKPGLASEIARIERAGGTVCTSKMTSSVPRVNGVLALSRSFADHSLKAPYNGADADWVTVKGKIQGPFKVPSTQRTRTTGRVAGSDFYAVAGSDGVWDVMSSKEVTRAVLEWINDKDSKGGRGSLKQLCNELVDECIERWKRTSGGDNVTMTIMHISSRNDSTAAGRRK